MKGFKHTGNGPMPGHSFTPKLGFTGSAGQNIVKPYVRGPRTPKVKAFAEGGKVIGNFVGQNAPQDAPTGKVNFQDYKRGGKTSRMKSGKKPC